MTHAEVLNAYAYTTDAPYTSCLLNGWYSYAETTIVNISLTVAYKNSKIVISNKVWEDHKRLTWSGEQFIVCKV